MAIPISVVRATRSHLPPNVLVLRSHKRCIRRVLIREIDYDHLLVGYHRLSNAVETALRHSVRLTSTTFAPKV